MSKPQKIEISHRTIVFTVFFLASVWFLFKIRQVILQVFLALLIMAILNPTVRKLEKMRIPRAVSVLIVYVVVFVVFGVMVAQMAPLLLDQSTKFANFLPNYLEGLNIPAPLVEQVTTEFTSQITRLPGQFLKISVSVFSNLLAVFTVLFFALYFLIAREKLDKQLSTIFPEDEKRQEQIDGMLEKLEQKLGGWARGQIVLMIIVGLATYIGLLILRVPFALPLAIIAGVLEIVPNIGPIIAAIPAVIVGFSVTPFTGLAVGALAFLIQQLEIYMLVPKVMERSAGLSPIVTLLSLVIGLEVAGVVGAILSIPVVISGQVLLNEFVFKK
jgi:predicted PurR-regulated permease PerM